MKNLWAPWRMEYLEAPKDRSASAPPADRERGEEPSVAAGTAPDTCLFCRVLRAPREQDRANLVLSRRDRSFVILNRYPYANAHLMVVPNVHVSRLTALAGDVHDELFRGVTEMSALLERRLAPQGLNVGLNLGEAAGAGIAGHLHVHLVPRWNGDTNFMPVLAETRVIGEHLLATYDRLRDGL